MDWLNSGYWNTDFLTEPSFWVGTLIFCLIAYMIGSLNAGQMLSIIGSKNLGESGSGNFGATNAGRLYGAKGFAIVFIFDLSKAIFAAIILTSIATKGTFEPLPTTEVDYIFYYASIPASMIFLVIGHSWPIYFGLKGGKGVATAFGSIIVINWILALVALAIFGIVIYLTRWTSLGSIAGTFVGGLLILIFHPMFIQATPEIFFYWTYNWIAILSIFFVTFLVIFKHKNNIIRMIQGKDPFIKKKKLKNKEI